MTVRDEGAGYRRAADSEDLRALAMVFLTFVGLVLVVLGVVGAEV